MPGDNAARVTPAAIGAFLRALAVRAERDHAFAQGVAEALAESGLLVAPRARRASPRPATRAREPGARTETLDPFAALRAGGESGLRVALEAVEVAALHAIVRAHRLDPARISARWSSRERLVELIVAQARARASHGQAFSHV
jgi:hypothetical protein